MKDIRKTQPKIVYLIKIIGLILITFSKFSLAQPFKTYLPFNKQCTEAQIKQYLEDLNHPDRTELVYLGLKVVCEKESAKILIELLMNQDSNVRLLAAHGLALSGIDQKKALPVLIASLEDENISIRVRSIYVLGQINFREYRYNDQEIENIYTKHLIPALKKALADEDSRIRNNAAFTLVYLEYSRLKSAPYKILESPPESKNDNSSVETVSLNVAKQPRAVIAKAVKQYSATVAKLIPVLINALKDKDKQSQAAAAESLGIIGKGYPTAISALIKAAGDNDVDVRASVIQALGEIGKSNGKLVIPALIAALKDTDGDIVDNAVDILGEFGSEARTAVLPLIISLRRNKENYNIPANDYTYTETFKKIGKDAVPLLLKELKDNNRFTRNVAAKALGEIGLDAKQAIPSLILLLKDPDRQARNSVIESLSNFKVISVPQLLIALDNQDVNIRTGAAEALGKIGVKAVTGLTQAFSSSNARVREGIILAFMHMYIGNNDINGAKAKQMILTTVRAAVNDSQEVVRYRAILCLQKLEPNVRNIPIIPKNALIDENEKIRLLAAQNLIYSDQNLDQQAFLILIRAWNDRNSSGDFRAKLIELFEKIGERAVPALIDALKHPESKVRRNAAEALGAIGKNAKTSIPFLLDALKDKDDSVRDAAAEALERITPNYQDIIPALVSAFSSGENISYELGSGLVQNGRESVPELITAFEKKDNSTRIKIAGVLREINNNTFGGETNFPGEERELKDITKIPKISGFEDKATSAVSNICAALKDKDPKVRSAAIIALESISIEATNVIPCLIDALDDNDEKVRYQAASALRKTAKLGVPELVSALRNKSAYVRKGIAFALGNVKPPPANVVTSLKAIVDNENEDLEVRRVAASSLEEVGYDMQQFFMKYNLVSPQNAVCPTIQDPEDSNTFHYYRYNIYSGRCEYVNSIANTSGGSALFAAIRRFFSGKK